MKTSFLIALLFCISFSNQSFAGQPLAQKACEIAMQGPLQTAIPGGVPHSPPSNQHQEEICWSYSLTEGLVEGLLKKAGREIVLAPRYNMFYHYYSQFKTHLPYFRRMQNELKETEPSKEVEKTQAVLLDAYHFFSNKPKAAATGGYQPYVPDIGSSGNVALLEVKQAGLVPKVAYPDAPFYDAKQEAKLENAIPAFIRDVMLDDKNLDAFQGVDASGVNNALWDALAKKLKPILKVTPLKPTDTFEYAGKTYTPLSFMDFVGFQSEEYRPVISSESTMEDAFKAIVDHLNTRNEPAMIGVTLFGDDITDSITEAGKTGTFTLDPFKDLEKLTDIGGHEMTVVDYLVVKKAFTSQSGVQYKKGDVWGFLVKNSWGDSAGLSINGTVPISAAKGEDLAGNPDADIIEGSTRRKAGYYRVSLEFLRFSASKNIKDPFDFVIHKDILAKYPRLKIEH